MKDKYILHKKELADFQIFAIGNKETGKVICHFNHENEESEKLSKEILDFLNKKDK